MYEALIDINWFTIAATLLNTLILFLILKHFLYQPVKKILQDREDEVKATYAHADEEKAEAQRLRSEYERQMATVREQAGEIMKSAAQKAQANAGEILADAQKKAEERTARADQQIEAEKRKALSEARDEIAGLALAAAEQVVKQELDPAKNEKLIEDFLNRMGEPETPDLSAGKRK